MSASDATAYTEAVSLVPNLPKSSVTGHRTYYVREMQPWAVNTERQRHNQALWMYGENAMFVLLWHLQDFQDGTVQRCPACYLAYGATARAYKQSAKRRCSDCYGTTFEGGYRAKIVRPVIFTDGDEGETFSRRGVDHGNTLSVETTTDFRVRTGDYLVRQNGVRYQLQVPARVTLRTGFGIPNQIDSAIAYNLAQAREEDPSSVVYDIPPIDPADLQTLLQTRTRRPVDFTATDVLRAPLIPVKDSH